MFSTRRKASLPEAKDSDGAHQYISTGTIVQRDECIVQTKKTLGLFGGSKNLSMNEYKSEFIQSENDAAPGSSGGPLIDNANGEPVGVLHSSANENWETEECKGSTFSTSSQQIRSS